MTISLDFMQKKELWTKQQQSIPKQLNIIPLILSYRFREQILQKCVHKLLQIFDQYTCIHTDTVQEIILIEMICPSLLLLKYTNDSSSNYVNISEIQNTFLW